ncbi:MAG: SLBB domain-containing protein, partial [Pseudothermotoga sp.]
MKKILLLTILFSLVTLIFAEYTLRVGDTVRIEVFGYAEMTRDCTVDSDGFISYVGIGRIKVDGMTLSELEKITNEKMRKLIPNPVVSVSLVSYAPRYVYVQGIVSTRINIGIKPTTLSQIISIVGKQSEGQGIEVIDLENIRIIRGRESFLVDLSSFYEGKLDADILVYEDDIIYIPQKSLLGYIKILGAVRNPSAFSYTKGITLTAAISLAGGIVTDIGDPQNIYLTRSGVVQRINLEEILTGKMVDMELKPGDQIYVPKIEQRYAYIVGFVTKPGVYDFLKDEPLTLKRLIAKAGGVANEIKYIDKILVTQNGNQKEYSPALLLGDGDVPLTVGSYVNVLKKPERFVYVVGKVRNPGRVDFQPEEQMKISVLLPKAGGYVSDQVEKGGTIKVYRSAQVFEISSKDLKNKDFDLTTGDLISVEYEDFYVYVVGNLSVTGRMALEPEEPRKLSTIIKKIGQVDDRIFESVW